MYTVATARFAAVLALTLALGCDNEGKAPPTNQLYFPVDIAFAGDGASEQLLVANANFDLKYRGGTLLSLDVSKLNAAFDACGDECVLASLDGFQSSYVELGSQASDLVVSANQDVAYLTVRSDVNITSVRLDAGGQLSCSEQGSSVCDAEHRRVDETEAFERGLDFSREPVAIEVIADQSGEGRDFLLVAHRSGKLSLLRESSQVGQAPELLDVYDELPSGLTRGALQPDDELFWFGQSGGFEIIRVGIAGLSLGNEARLYRAQSVFLRGLNDGEDVRDIAFDEQTGEAYILLNDPQSLAIVRPTPDQLGGLESRAVIPVGSGPSRLTSVEVGEGLTRRRWLLVSCFGSREIYIIDPVDGQIVSIEHGFSGPFELTTDSTGRLYVVDFRASVIHVISLSELATCFDQGGIEGEPCRPRRVGIIGSPNIVDELL